MQKIKGSCILLLTRELCTHFGMSEGRQVSVTEVSGSARDGVFLA
jgi:hypothetical protein